jgi:hypothetical protein
VKSQTAMACVRFLATLPGLLLTLLGILTIVHIRSPFQQGVHRVGLSHNKSIERLKSNGWSFAPRDYLSEESISKRLVSNSEDTATAWNGSSAYKQIGTSGVAAMQMSVIDDQYVILFDKAEHNPLETSDGINAWSALLDTHAHTVRALKLVTNSFCAGELYFNLCRVLQLSLYSFLSY